MYLGTKKSIPYVPTSNAARTIGTQTGRAEPINSRQGNNKICAGVFLAAKDD